MGRNQPWSPLSGSVLVDNSTYFSASVLVSSGELDPLAVFNLGNFIDSLILAENICLAPTINWSPSDSDSLLFGAGKPCSQVDLRRFGNEDLGELFGRALASSLADLDQNPHIPQVDADHSKTVNILLNWRSQAIADPVTFLPVYSGQVVETDVATRRYLAKLPSLGNEAASPERRLAHYLLRTNVAFELSEYLPYSPHSNRIRFVCEKITQNRQYARALGLEFLKKTETAVDRKLSQIPTLGLHSNLPLALAVVLSGTDDPTLIVARALELRNTRAAKSYRRWMTKLLSAQRGSIRDQETAQRELEEARSVLSTELIKLLAHRSRISQLTAVADSFDLGNLDLEDSQERVKLGKQLIVRVARGYRRQRSKRRIAIFLSLAKRGSLETLNTLLHRTFKKRLSDEQIQYLNELRIDHSEHIRRLR